MSNTLNKSCLRLNFNTLHNLQHIQIERERESTDMEEQPRSGIHLIPKCLTRLIKKYKIYEYACGSRIKTLSLEALHSSSPSSSSS